MPDRSHRHERLNLPSLDQLTQGLIPCHAGCQKLFPSKRELSQHIASDHQPARHNGKHQHAVPHHQPTGIEVRPEYVDLDARFARQNIESEHVVLNPQLARHDVRMGGHPVDLPSPVESTDSEEFLRAFTPVHSRAPSPEPFVRRSSGTGPIRSTRRERPNDPYRSLSEDDGKLRQGLKKVKKMQKEKENRADQAAVLWRVEDRFRAYLGYNRKEQSSGNGNGCGLDAGKITLMRGEESLLQYFLDREYRLATMSGRLAEWQGQILEILEKGRQAAPFDGTLLQGDESDLCRHADSKAKKCLTHGHPDWRECRRIHAQARFDMNLRHFQSQLRQQHMPARPGAPTRRQG